MSDWPSNFTSLKGEKKCKEVDFEEELQVFHKYKEVRSSIPTSTCSVSATPVSLDASDLQFNSILQKKKPSNGFISKTTLNTKFHPKLIVQNHTLHSPFNIQLQQLRCALTYVQTSLHHEPLLHNQEAAFEEQAQQVIDHAAVSIIQMVRKIKELESKLDLQDKKWKEMEQFIQTTQSQQQHLEKLLKEKTSRHSEIINALQVKQDELTQQYQPLIQAQTSLLDEVLGNIETSYFSSE